MSLKFGEKALRLHYKTFHRLQYYFHAFREYYNCNRGGNLQPDWYRDNTAEEFALLALKSVLV